MASSEPLSKQPPPFSTTVSPQDAGKDEVESPSVSAPHALARFEFECGRSNDGTKILMVEWDDDEHTRNTAGEWHITWEGMRTVLPAGEKKEAPGKDQYEQPAAAEAADSRDGTVAEKGGTHRMYFLLLPKVAVPPLVTLTYQPRAAGGRETVWTTNPLPAIFPPELGASARTAGMKGVLHTIWAKQRLRSLQKEIDAEARENAESVGLAMVLSEQEWIGEHFGVQARASVAAPTSPGTPGGAGGRLTEKLKGLRLGTSEHALSPRAEDEQSAGWQNPLSPESSDVAVSSFAAIKGARAGQPSPFAALAAKPAQKPAPEQQAARRMAPQAPPESIVQQQQQQQLGAHHPFGGIASMIAGSDAAAAFPPHDDHEEGLFAMPISPRSPEMTKSPFSFAGPDTQRHLQGVQGQAS